jgi:hypothetical protein
MKDKIFLLHIGLGLVYFITKLFFFSLHMVCIHGFLWGTLSTILITFSGIFAYKKYKSEDIRSTKNSIAKWLMLILPLFILPLTPIIMINEAGTLWLEGIAKLTSFIVFEVVAVFQVVLAIYLIKSD